MRRLKRGKVKIGASFEPGDVKGALREIGKTPQVVLLVEASEADGGHRAMATMGRGTLEVHENHIQIGFAADGDIRALPGYYKPDEQTLNLSSVEEFKVVARSVSDYSTHFPSHYFLVAIFGHRDPETGQPAPLPKAAILIVDTEDELEEIIEGAPPMGFYFAILDGKIAKSSDDRFEGEAGEFAKSLFSVN